MTPTHEQIVFWMTPKRMRYLWKHIEMVPREPLGCWLWTGPDDKNGYGIYPTRMDGRRVNLNVHRLLLILTYGADWPEDMTDTAHTVCTNRACCNPTHMIPSTHPDNLKDRRPWSRRPRSSQGRVIQAFDAGKPQGEPMQ